MDIDSLHDRLKRRASSGAYPMHMPGHKRNTALSGGLPYDIDITEIPGFDDLSDMRGVLADTAALGAKLYGARAAFPLVNGSTGGILAAVSAAAGRGGSIVMSKYSHRAVYNAAAINGLRPVLFTPAADPLTGAIGSANADDIAALLAATPDTRAVVVTSPTYDGVVSDIKGIARAVHARGLPLIVDAAHGAHFGFSGDFPRNAVRLGADIEIVSLHKTLPSLTQTSLLLCGDSDEREIARALSVFQTSSPSYVLLASIDRCLRLLDERAREMFAAFGANLRALDDRLSGLKRLRRVYRSECFFAFDMSKIFISTNFCDITGGELADILRDKYGFETETASEQHILAMTSVADTPDALERFASVLLEIDAGLNAARKEPAVITPPGMGGL